MRLLKRFYNYFTVFEIILWSVSITLIGISFLIFDTGNFLTLCASLIGCTSLIFNAKGNPAGQFLMIVFSVMYGIISFSYNYYGEMITYLCMTAPMALFALVSWLKNPYMGRKSEVTINTISKYEIWFMLIITAAVTAVFYFILKYLNTSNLIPSTLSVTTSFMAVYLTFRRSAYFALLYAANDIVLIVLWTLAAISDISYISVMFCFLMFLINDIYGFFNWLRMKKRQQEN